MILNKENMKKSMMLITFAVLLYLGVQNITIVWGGLQFILQICLPFVVGGAIAFVLNVPMNFFERHILTLSKGSKASKKLARPVSFLLSLVFVWGILSVVLLVVIPQLGETMLSVGKNIEQAIPKLQIWLIETFRNNKQVLKLVTQIEFNWHELIQKALDFLTNGAGSMLNSTMTAAKTIVSGFTNFFIAFVFACYILLQKEKLTRHTRKVFFAFLNEKWVTKVLYICSLSYRTFSSFVTGQCMEAVILGSMFVVVLSVLQFPYALLIGILIAFTALIPIFGAFIGCAVGAFLILVADPMKAIWFVVIFLILQQIEGNLIYPHVVGGTIGLPSIWVLVAVSIGGSLMGVVGMLIFIPLTSVVYTLFRETVNKRLKRKGIPEDVICEKKTEPVSEEETVK